MGLAFAEGFGGQAIAAAETRRRSPSAPRTLRRPRYRAGPAELAVISPNASGSIRRRRGRRSDPRRDASDIDRRSSGNDFASSASSMNVFGKETAVAVHDRLPVPRAVEHVEAVVDAVQRVGRANGTSATTDRGCAASHRSTCGGAVREQSATRPCACDIRRAAATPTTIVAIVVTFRDRWRVKRAQPYAASAASARNTAGSRPAPARAGRDRERRSARSGS